MVNLAIIGFGDLARSVYGPAIAGLAPLATVAGVVESDSDRHREAQKVFSAAVICSSLNELLGASKIDCVLIATPPGTHADIAVEAFGAGLAVYVEKPLAADFADGQRIVDAWTRAGTVGRVGFNYRFNPLVQALKQALSVQEIGPVVAVETSFGLVSDDLPPWKKKRASGGGALLDLASHHIDLLRFLFDSEVHSVGARIWSDQTEDDNALLHLEMASGLVGQVRVSLSSIEEDRIEVYGRTGKLIYDRYNNERIHRTGQYSSAIRKQLLLNRLTSFIPGRDLREKLRSPWRETSFPRALKRFAEAVATGEPGQPDIEDGWKSLQVVLAAEQSHREDRVLEVGS